MLEYAHRHGPPRNWRNIVVVANLSLAMHSLNCSLGTISKSHLVTESVLGKERAIFRSSATRNLHSILRSPTSATSGSLNFYAKVQFSSLFTILVALHNHNVRKDMENTERRMPMAKQSVAIESTSQIQGSFGDGSSTYSVRRD